MADWLIAAAIGLFSGVLSGMFGIGGGIITTPALRLVLGAPALIAVGTPLPVIMPGALTGALTYWRNGTSDPRAGLILGLAGVITAVLGALATRLVGGTMVLIGTALLIVWAAADMTLQVLRPGKATEPGAEAEAHASLPLLIGVGALTGLYSGFFGLGGGFVLVPMLTRWGRFPIKRAIGTSLVAVTILAVPGTITHALLGNIDWALAAALAVGVVPGAVLGARVSLGTRDHVLRVGFAALLVVSAVWLAANEILGAVS